MATFDFDLFTIGAGSGGVRASRVAATYGAKVAIAEERYLGGTCVNVGCIPKKLLFYAAHYSFDFADAAGFGWSVGAREFSWKRLIENKDREIQRLNLVYERLLKNSGVTLVPGHAELLDAHTVIVGRERYTAEYILLATGSWPVVPPLPGAEHAITSNEAFFLPALPQSVLIVGGGYIGVEFAGIFHGLGAKVTQVHRGPMFLRGFDDDVRAFLAQEMGKKGVALRFNAAPVKIERRNGRKRVAFADGSTAETELVMFATGRLPNTRKIGLEKAGVELNEAGAVIVDEYSRTTAPNIYAVGDCTDRLKLTPVAIAEGQAVAETLFNNRPTKPDYTNVPTAIFSQPNVGAVGLTEQQARRKHPQVDVYRTVFKPLKHTLTGSDEQTMMKLVVDRQTDRVLGCHMVGADAGEIIQGLAIALNCGATKAQFDATIGIHPTAAEEFVTMREKVAASR
ncbi:MAG TPA: glutathione-disulfide reductase [Candidatus Acidoferrales bacterium]|nr:glutathione-disulfide reductase [Candidatus Acidoferrales bacterium]